MPTRPFIVHGDRQPGNIPVVASDDTVNWGGLTGASLSPYTHVQSSPSTTWVIIHNLGRRPVAITVYDDTNTEVEGDFHYDSDNQVTMTFSQAISGRAELV